MRAFLDFMGGRPIIAHNASLTRASWPPPASAAHKGSSRSSSTRSCSPTPAARPERHKLDIIQASGACRDSNHHRAFDDAGSSRG